MWVPRKKVRGVLLRAPVPSLLPQVDSVEKRSATKASGKGEAKESERERLIGVTLLSKVRHGKVERKNREEEWETNITAHARAPCAPARSCPLRARTLVPLRHGGPRNTYSGEAQPACHASVAEFSTLELRVVSSSLSLSAARISLSRAFREDMRL